MRREIHPLRRFAVGKDLFSPAGSRVVIRGRGILFSFVTRKNFSFVTRKNFTSRERYLVSLDANTMANKYKSPEVVLVLFVSASSSL